MTTPKNPPTKTESAIQLGNMYRFMARGSGRKLKKIGEKPSKVSKSKKIGEVQTRPKKSLQNQKTPKIKYGSSSIETTESLQGLTKKHGEKLSPIRKAYLTKKQKLEKKFPPPKHLN